MYFKSVPLLMSLSPSAGDKHFIWTVKVAVYVCVDGLSSLCQSVKALECEPSVQEKEGGISDYMRYGLSGSSSPLP